MTLFVRLLFILSLTPALPPTLAHAQDGAATDSVRTVGGSYIVNLRDVEIPVLAEQVSNITGRTIILDPQVNGSVTVISTEALGAGGVWELFQSTMRVNGYAVLKTGRNWRVVPENEAAQGAEVAVPGVRSQDLVTRLIRLGNLPAEEAATVVRPLINGFGDVQAVSEPSAIVVTDYADNVRRVEELIRQLDRGRGSGVTALPLKYAGADYVAEVVRGLVPDGSGTTIAADTRGNMLLLRGSSAAIAEIRGLVASIDRPGGALPETRVFRLKNSDAEFITSILVGVLGGGEGEITNPVARSIGRDIDSRAGERLGAGPTSRTGRRESPVTVLDNGSLAGRLGEAVGLAGGRDGGSARNAGASAGLSTETLSIQAATEINAVVVRGLPGTIAEIDALIQELDTRRPQVLIEAAIVELTGEAAESLGLQLGIGANTPTGVAGATSFSGLGLPLQAILRTLGNPTAIGLLPNGLSAGIGITDDFGILVQALATSSSANLLSTPSLTTLDNQVAEIVVGQNVPFRTGSFTTDGNSLNPFTTIEREDVGITMRVNPRVYEGDVIKLDISQEVSSLVGASIAGAADLITNRRSIQTTVLADDRGTVVLGGLIADDRTRTEITVPLLGDIPIIGNLFKFQRESRSKRTLFVFLRPTILRTRDDVIAAARAKYDRIRALDMSADRREALLFSPDRPKLPQDLDGVY
ncbi:MAG: type II secretion system secretin GspD [Pacificimonas sp.]